MLGPRLIEVGDRVERETWGTLQHYFPHYEDFWRINVYPLRAECSILLRDGVDEDFELLAMCHYSTYANLARAKDKIDAEADGLRFFDEIYANLKRSAELAKNVVQRFSVIQRRCQPASIIPNDSALDSVDERLGHYRNLIHRPLAPYRKDSDGHLCIPKPDLVRNVVPWSTLLYHSQEADFVDVNVQLNNDFMALCSALEDVWKQMCDASESLMGNSKYNELRNSGTQPPQHGSVAAPAASGTWTVINTRSNES